jgi:hypothetical protein
LEVLKATSYLSGAKRFALIHLLAGARKIMNDGATLGDAGFELGVWNMMAALFPVVGAGLLFME